MGVSAVGSLTELTRRQAEDMQSLRQTVLWSANDIQFNIQEVKNMVEATEGSLKRELKCELEKIRSELGLERRRGPAATAAEQEAALCLKASGFSDTEASGSLAKRVDEAVGVGIAELRGELVKHLHAMMALLRNTMGVFDASLGVIGGVNSADARKRFQEVGAAITPAKDAKLADGVAPSEPLEEANSLPLLQGFREQLDSLVHRIDGIFRARLSDTATPMTRESPILDEMTATPQANAIKQTDSVTDGISSRERTQQQQPSWTYKVPQPGSRPHDVSPAMTRPAAMPKRGSSPTRVLMTSPWTPNSVDMSSQQGAGTVPPGAMPSNLGTVSPNRMAQQQTGSMQMPAGSMSSGGANAQTRAPSNNPGPGKLEAVLTASGKWVAAPNQQTNSQSNVQPNAQQVAPSASPPMGTSNLSARVPMMR